LRGALTNEHQKIVEILRDKGARTKFEEIQKQETFETIQLQQFVEDIRILFEQMITTKETDKITVDSLKRFLKKRGLDSKRNQVLEDQIQKLANGGKTISWDAFLGLMKEKKDNLLTRFLLFH
jgi:tRNA C32,U32 (ribose-2'-O)-methylase TrmJ